MNPYDHSTDEPVRKSVTLVRWWRGETEPATYHYLERSEPQQRSTRTVTVRSEPDASWEPKR